MVNREKRNQLIALIHQYLDGQAKLTEFDVLMLEYYKSDDPALYFVALEFSVHTEVDANALTKREWDYIQRLLLLLESNSTVSYQHSIYRSWTQPVAAVLLFTCLLVVLLTGLGFHLFLYFIPMGLVSIWLSFHRCPNTEARPFDEIVTPFYSIADLHLAYESANFIKQRYPVLSQRKCNVFFEKDYGGLVLALMIWTCMPLPALFLMCFPEPVCDTQVQPA